MTTFAHNPQAVVGVTYDHATKAFTFSQAGGATIVCRTNADCPVLASQTIYVGTRATNDLFVATDFTDSDSGGSATSGPPLSIARPAQADPTHRVAWALPEALTLTSVGQNGSGNDCTSLMDCTNGINIMINSQDYKFYPADARVNQVGGYALINWSE